MIAAGFQSLREKAAQLLVPRLGSNMPPPVTAGEDVERFAAQLAECPVGGLLVFNGCHPDLRDALRTLQQSSRIPLLVAADMERGVGQQVRGATVFPHAMAYSALEGDGERLLETSARVQAREALACGIHVTFSPVADVNRDPRNPIIATRAFSTDPDTAARLVRAFVRGCREEGLLTTAKHFPGHGNTSRDSHAELPVVTASREELEAFDLVPFRAAVDSGVDLVMSAHVVFPALDPDRPATLSPAILRDLLRGEMGFEGVVVTDSLLMGAIRQSHVTPGEQAAALVRGGVDMLLDVPDPAAAAEGIADAVESGRLDRVLLDEAVARVLALKVRLLERFGEAVFTSPESVVDPGEVGSGAAVAVVLIQPHRTRFDPVEEPLGAFVREALPGAFFRQLGPEDETAHAAVLAALDRARVVVVVLVAKPAAWHTIGLLPEQDALVRRIVDRKPAVVASLGSPYVLDRYADAAARICAYSDVEVSQRALVDRLVGR